MRESSAFARRLTLTLVLAGAFCAACTGDGTQPPTTERSAPDPITVETDALWRDGTGRRNEIPRVEIRGESVLVFGDRAGELDRVLTVADAATGEVRWQLDSQKSLPGSDDRLRAGSIAYDGVPIVGADDDWTAFVPYANAAREFGIAGLAGADGEVRWATPPVRDPKAATQQVLGASDDVVVSAVDVFDARARTTASDAVSGRRLWTAPGVLPQFVVGDTVLGQTGKPRSPAPGAPEPSPDSTVVGLDAATGKKKWDLPGSRVFLTLRELAVVSVPGKKLVVDAVTGRRVTDLGAVAYCVSDQVSLVVCQSDDQEVLTVFDATSRKLSRAEVPTSRLLGAWHGHVFLEDRIVDRAGHEVLADTVIAMSDEYVVLSRDDGFAVHRRTG